MIQCTQVHFRIQHGPDHAERSEKRGDGGDTVEDLLRGTTGRGLNIVMKLSAIPALSVGRPMHVSKPAPVLEIIAPARALGFIAAVEYVAPVAAVLILLRIRARFQGPDDSNVYGCFYVPGDGFQAHMNKTHS